VSVRPVHDTPESRGLVANDAWLVKLIAQMRIGDALLENSPCVGRALDLFRIDHE
jgi:hypothetical protein